MSGFVTTLGKVDLSKMSRYEMERFAKELIEQERAYEDNKLGNYKPHEGQRRFHASNKKVRLIVAGNRFGKTTASFLEAVQIALGIHPSKKIPIPNRGKLYGESYAAIEETFKLKIEEWVPHKFLDPRKPFIKNQLGQLMGVNFANGSLIKFGTYDQEEKKAESSNWNYCAFDEPPPRNIYIANLRGTVDNGGLMWFSMTPLREPWIFDDLYEPGLKGEKPYIEVFEGSSYDNPYLPKEHIDLFAAELSEEEREVRILGKFRKLQGLVIDTYDPFLSDIDPFELDEGFSIYEGIDPHPRKANCALYKAIDKDGFRYSVGEISFDGGIYDFGKKLAQMRKELTGGGAQLIASVADSSLNQKDMMFKINQRDELIRSLREEGEVVFPVVAQKKDWLGPGIQKLRDLFRPVFHPGLGKKMPMEYLFKSCVPRYKYELGHYQWPKDPLDQAKPIAKHNEFVDASRYIESLAPTYVTPGKQKLFVKCNQGAYSRLNLEDRRKYANRR